MNINLQNLPFKEKSMTISKVLSLHSLAGELGMFDNSL